MPEDTGDKSQEATPHRRQQAREQGHVAKSQDLGSALVLLGGVGVMMMLGGGLVDVMGRLAQSQLGGPAWLSGTPEQMLGQWDVTLAALAKVLLPIVGLILAVALMSHVVQVGFLFLPEKAAPDLTRIDPLKGTKRLFSLPSLVRLLFGIFKVSVVAGVAVLSLYAQRETLIGLAALSVPEIAAYLVQIALWTTLKIAVALLVLAILDYAFQRWKHEQDLRMTTQEVREEVRNLQGDPQIAARRKAVQRQLVLNRLQSAVPGADVVVTNPTELAVAIKYDPEKMAAPTVVAKGAGVLAQRIRQLALEHGIPIVEKKPLAQALYRDVDVSQPIPGDLYTAVAEVLAYVYRLQGKPHPQAP